MKLPKTVLILATLLLLSCVTALWLMKPRPASDHGGTAQSRAPQITGTSVTMTPVLLTEIRSELPEAEPVSPAGSAAPARASRRPSPQPTTNAIPQAGSGKPELLDPLAREALIFVGADPEAEAYWFGAINDPTLPPNERQDLIEDLNEEGLSDPKHPGPEDLPLIMSRIELIEEVGPLAMDDVNSSAFAEAYKDLWNLLYVAMGRGQPVK